MPFLELFARIDAVDCAAIMETAKEFIVDKVYLLRKNLWLLNYDAMNLCCNMLKIPTKARKAGWANMVIIVHHNIKQGLNLSVLLIIMQCNAVLRSSRSILNLMHSRI
jgi:hypothetical protein